MFSYQPGIHCFASCITAAGLFKGVSHTITGLNPGGINVFRRNGTDPSLNISYNESSINQIIFVATINNLQGYIWLRTGSDGYNPIDFSTRPVPGNSFAITSSSLSPEGFNRDADPAPGPLPLIGAVAAFAAASDRRAEAQSVVRYSLAD
jgi:hypothetical protein